MAVILLDISFLSNPLASAFKFRPRPLPAKRAFLSCSHPSDEDNHSSSRRDEKQQFVKLALVAVAAGVLTLGSVDPAAAGKSGGRVGGQAFRPSAPPRASGPRINNSRTNVFINPPVAPPLVGGYGYGYGVPFYGGWGWSPFSFFAPGPSVAIGVGGGFDFFLALIFLSVISSVVRRFLRSRDQDEDDF